MPSPKYAATKTALRSHGRGVGRVKRFDAQLIVRMTREQHSALGDASAALGLGLAEYVRLVLSDALQVPDEKPNLDNTKGA